ncbi:helicase-like transcription factor [Mya arenaria]|uniref:helicase-like transcription factor n=1 Tax=Mya arenaria TaxID=6604 RepID=UPI0022E3C287|nr:helicase-like transcription factor [Mya arenaria]
MGHSELDDEICFGSLRGDIVGLQYYAGTVNKNEMVALQREPTNRYDVNAIRVLNVDRIQVGHIKRELARPLAYIMDGSFSRLEGVVPSGNKNMYKMPVDLSLWGKPEHQATVVNRLKSCGYYLTGGSHVSPSGAASSSQEAALGTFATIQPRRTYLTPAEVKNELDRVFETMKKGDKTTMAEPAQAVCTQLYPHQKQALNWMMVRENNEVLPPFWEERSGRYFNTVLNFTTNNRPKSVCGGLLADDMGLGKTLEVIALIVTNFVDGQPLAKPIQGVRRQSKAERLALDKAKDLPVDDLRQVETKQSLQMTRRKSLSCHAAKSLAWEPALPELPDDQECGLSEDDDDDDDDDDVIDDDLPAIDEKTMLCKEDPNFSPLVKSKGKRLSKRVEVEEPTACRPRRGAKRPVRYTYSSDEEMMEHINNDETPKKKPKLAEKASGTRQPYKGKAPVSGSSKAKGKKRKTVTEPQIDQQDCTNKSKDSYDNVVKQSLEQDATNNEEGQSHKKLHARELNGKTATDCTKCALTGNGCDKTVEKDLEETSSKDEIAEILKKENEQKSDTKIKTGDESECSELPDLETVAKHKEQFEEENECPELPDLLPLANRIENPDRESKYLELPDLLPVASLIKTHDLAGNSLLEETVVHANYTKPSIQKVGEVTGRTLTLGPRCTLIVCPLSVLSNWLDQLENHVDPRVHLSIYLYYGSGRTSDVHLLENQDVVITTYSTVAADFRRHEGKKVGAPLRRVRWLRIVLDEGHSIKNPAALQTKAIIDLQAERRWILTGTPIQNSMKDLWSLINFLQVNPFTDQQWWRRTIERPLERGDSSALKRVQHLMGHLAMRRTKTQMYNGKPLVKLPGRQVCIEHVTLSHEERNVYNAMQKDGKLIVSKYFKQGSLLHHYGDVLAILLRLRQLCCHPFLVSRAADAIKDTLSELETNGGVLSDALREKLIGTLVEVLRSGTDEECPVCLDSLSAPVITCCAHVYCRPCIESVIRNEKPVARCPLCRGDISTDKLLEVPPEEIQPVEGEKAMSIQADTWKSSAKVDALMNTLLKLRTEEPGTRSVVVSQFTSLLTVIEHPLSANGIKFVRLDGTMNQKVRTRAIEEFSEPGPRAPTVMLLSLKAGGVGINLTAASRLFLLDPAWNPACEEQCFDRCHRLGQTKDVIITKYIVEDSVEEKMLDMQEKKRRLMQGAFGQKQTAEERRQNRITDIKNLLDF